MRGSLTIIFVSVLMLSISCSKSPKERDIFFEREENLDGFVAFVVNTDCVNIYDLDSYSLVDSVEVRNVKRVFTYKDTVFFHNLNLYKYDFESEKSNKVKELLPTTLAVYMTDGGEFCINQKGMLYNDDWIIEDTITDYYEGYKNIWLLTPRKIISFGKKDRIKDTRELEDPITFCVSPYGLRVYVAFRDRIDVFLEEDLSLVKTIKVDETPVDLLTTPAGNKIYILSEGGLYVIERATYDIIKIANLPALAVGLQLSRDGSYGIVICSDRLLIFDAGSDEIVKEIMVSCKDVKTSPLDSRIYVLSDAGMVVIKSDSLVIEKFLDIKGEKLFIPPFRVSIKEEDIVKQPTADLDKTVRLFTIQVSSSKSKSSAELLVERLISAGYPAYVTGSNGWFKVRVGAFRSKNDALLVSEKVDGFVKEKSWVLESDINLKEIPSLNLRDLDGNGYMEEACVRDERDIVIFEIKDGVYEEIRKFTGYLEKYTGDPSFYDADGDGRLEIVTPTLQGGVYSVIKYKDGEWREEIKRFE